MESGADSPMCVIRPFVGYAPHPPCFSEALIECRMREQSTVIGAHSGETLTLSRRAHPADCPHRGPPADTSEMPCIQAQYGSLSQCAGPSDTYLPDILNSEFSKFTMDLVNSEIAASTSLPSFSTFMDSYTGEFDAFLYQIPSTTPQSALKVEEFQVFGCYPGSFTNQVDETMSSSGSDYYGSPCSIPSPSTPGFQNHQVPTWESSYGAYSPTQNYDSMRPWTDQQKNSIPQSSFFSFGTPSHSPNMASNSLKMTQGPHRLDQQVVDPDVFALAQSSSAGFPSIPIGQGPVVLDSSVILDSPLSPSKARSPSSNEGRCAVCGDNASCQHYGVRTCEGCKGFFKVSCMCCLHLLIVITYIRL
ncbi:hypothetical protein GDO81_005201 [Engystomops pustulosus]|uniref:Nuclear receptor domain-containing protein n=1 Tax=Engystomops pustulosus TaxID=76066 RepID=A0AAV7CN79_ENGPU|nr:hypothetical protein GDO81_005201 [Engystomops pustulosus]KAG8585989.1 hypothetical protein GDO81_005201 [Engystomops pustulosus]KAG8585990.1 hypothetical protein GDO81_005201 [Engystomops pustulosus]KAG8585991.1 hypothetical protein GDO81_005201 [Engystomops pustulosus]KAG8585992.1 hypothetical protein GDO81_005201 [Engystomops pustulosus]